MDILSFLWDLLGYLLDWRLYLVLILLTIFTIYIGLKIQDHLSKNEVLSWDKFNKIVEEKSIRRVEHIPYNRNLPFWTPTWPISIVEGLAMVVQIARVGIPFIDPIVKKHGPIVKLSVMFNNVILVADISLVQKLLSISDQSFLNKPRDMYEKLFVEWLKDGLLASEYSVWQPHRKALSFCFTYKALATYSKVMDKHGQALASALEASCSPDGTIKGDLMIDLISIHSIRIIAEIVVGTKSSAFIESDEFFEVFKKGKKLLMSKVAFENTFKPLWAFSRQKKEYDKCAVALRKFINKDIEVYKEEMKDKLNDKPGSEGEEEIVGERPFRSVIEQMLIYNASEKEIYDEVGTFMSAGHETTSGAMHFFMQHMGEHPEIQAKCREELDNLYASKSEGLSMEDISNMKYLERCIMESLRITPTVPFFIRETSEDLEVDRLKFKRGTRLSFSPWVIHRLPNIYPEPEVFDPDRWLPEKIKERNFYAFMPFSHGPRNCIGFKFAMMEMKVILSWILRHFYISTEDKLNDVKFDFEITMVPRRNYRLILKKRNLS